MSMCFWKEFNEVISSRRPLKISKKNKNTCVYFIVLKKTNVHLYNCIIYYKRYYIHYTFTKHKCKTTRQFVLFLLAQWIEFKIDKWFYIRGILYFYLFVYCICVQLGNFLIKLKCA